MAREGSANSILKASAELPAHRALRVVAVVRAVGSRPDLTSETLAALETQQRPLDQIIIVVEHGSKLGHPDAVEVVAVPGDTLSSHAFGRGVSAAAEAAPDWLWILDGVTVPRTDALSELLAVAYDERALLPAPLLLASKIVDAQGRLHPDGVPHHELFEKEISVQACARRLLHLRAARHGSLLVSWQAVKRFGAPRSDLPVEIAGLEWTARMLRSWEDPGYLVPTSVAVRHVAPTAGTGQRRREHRSRARLLSSDAWTVTERLYQGFMLGADLVESIPGLRGARQPAHPA